MTEDITWNDAIAVLATHPEIVLDTMQRMTKQPLPDMGETAIYELSSAHVATIISSLHLCVETMKKILESGIPIKDLVAAADSVKLKAALIQEEDKKQ